MKLFPLQVLLFIFLSITSTQIKADSAVPNAYNKEDIRFSYLKNWEITEDTIDKDSRLLFVEGGDAIFIVVMHKSQATTSLLDFAKHYSSEARTQTSIAKLSEGEFSNIEEKLKTSTIKSVKESFSISVIGVTIPHIRKYYKIQTGEKFVFLITQVAIEDLPQTKPGFDLILNTFILK